MRATGASGRQATSSESSVADEAADLAARATAAARAELRGERGNILGAIGLAAPAPLRRARAVPERWTLPHVMDRMEEAFRVLSRLPLPTRPKGYINSMPRYLYDHPIQETSDRHVAVYEGSEESLVAVSVLQKKRRVLAFEARTPVSFYAQIRDCEVEFPGTVQLIGEGPSSNTAFYGRGNATIIVRAAEVRASAITVEGNLAGENRQGVS